MVFYSTMSDSYNRTFDKALELRDYDATVVSATSSETALAFPVRKTEDYKVCYNIAAYSSYSDGVNEWNITIEVSDISGGSYTTVGTISPVGTATSGEIPLSGAYVAGLDSDAEYIRVTATKTGSPGNLTYGAWITTV